MRPSSPPRRRDLVQASQQRLAPARPRSAAKRAGCRLRPSVAQFGQRRAGVGPGQHDALHVHHRLGEAGMHQHVAPVVHVGELVARRRPAAALGRARAVRAACRARGRRTSGSRRSPARGAMRDQRLRVGRHVQRHVGPEQVDAVFGRRVEARLCAAPAPRAPPRRFERAAVARASAAPARHERLRASRIAAAPPARAPPGRRAAATSRPSCAAAPDPLQPLVHAPADLLVQPGRAGGRREPLPSARRPADRWSAVAVGVGSHGAVSILSACSASPRRPFFVACSPPAQPVRDLPRLAVAAAVRCLHRRFAPPLPRCRRCALPVPPGAPLRRLPRRIRRRSTPASPPAPTPGRGRLRRAFKFHGEPGWAGALRHADAQRAVGRPALEQADLVLPVPLAPARLRERGYNQAWSSPAGWRPRKTDARLLLRVRDTPPSRPARAGGCQLRGAFAVEPLRATSCAAGAGAGRRRDDQRRVAGRGGAACCAPAGAPHVTAVVLARTDAPR